MNVFLSASLVVTPGYEVAKPIVLVMRLNTVKIAYTNASLLKSRVISAELSVRGLLIFLMPGVLF